MTRSLRLELVLTAIAFALSLVILFAIDFGLIGYSTTAQAQTAKGVVIAGTVFGAAWAGLIIADRLMMQSRKDPGLTTCGHPTSPQPTFLPSWAKHMSCQACVASLPKPTDEEESNLRQVQGVSQTNLLCNCSSWAVHSFGRIMQRMSGT